MQLDPTDSSLDALTEIGRLLQRSGYDFTAVTPETYRRNNARVRKDGTGTPRDALRDVFGWNRPFRRGDAPDGVVSLLERAGASKRVGDELISTVRYSTLAGNLFVHSGYPTLEDDSVFFGPDSYRFTAFVARELAAEPPRSSCRIVDVGCGSGVGGIVAGRLLAGSSVVLADINRRALGYARVNANLARLDIAGFCESDVLSGVDGAFDLVIANPPYMVDPQARLYRHGGAHQGAGLSLRMLHEGVQRLARGGRLLMYTGTAVVAGRDVFFEQAREILRQAGLRFRYEEIDPDVFGEELDEPAYADVERIAAVGLVVYANNAG